MLARPSARTPSVIGTVRTSTRNDVVERHPDCGNRIKVLVRDSLCLAPKHGSQVELRVAGASGRVQRRVCDSQATVRTASDAAALASASEVL